MAGDAFRLSLSREPWRSTLRHCGKRVPEESGEDTTHLLSFRNVRGVRVFEGTLWVAKNIRKTHILGSPLFCHAPFRLTGPYGPQSLGQSNAAHVLVLKLVSILFERQGILLFASPLSKIMIRSGVCARSMSETLHGFVVLSCCAGDSCDCRVPYRGPMCDKTAASIDDERPYKAAVGRAGAFPVQFRRSTS